MASPLRIVNYAVNGGGAGHLTRLCAINRWIRRYTQVLDQRAEIYFLTTSEADTLLFSERFASFKLPSKTIVADAGIDKTTYLALAKQWVWHSLGLLRPDLFVVDTFPRGSFGELLSALDLCRYKAFIHRSVKEEFLSRPDFAAMLPLYDLILVPEYEAETQGTLKGIRRGQLHYVGPILIREKAECESRETVRRHFAVKNDALLVYVSAGGGGDAHAESHLKIVCETLLQKPNVHVVIGAGPLYRGRSLHGPRITFLTQSGVAEWLSGMDFAVCSAGYNSFHELLHAGVPTIFLPQEKIADEQNKRAELAEKRGAAIHLHLPIEHPDFPSALSCAVETIFDPEKRAAARLCATEIVPQNHAREAAQRLLSLLLPPRQLELAQDAVNDTLLQQLKETDLSLEQVSEVAHALYQTGAAEWEAIPCEEALSLLRLSDTLGLSQPLLVRILKQLSGRLGNGDLDDKTTAVSELLASFSSFSDWPGVMAFLKQLPAQRGLSAQESSAECRRLLQALRTRSLDLYDGVRLLATVQTESHAIHSLPELVSSALRRLP
ncbi:MAG TPA: glycosyltransferase [Pseudomonadota bacterium]|nr:glycosyltransferase [Pseudomonadota bacterium]